MVFCLFVLESKVMISSGRCEICASTVKFVGQLSQNECFCLNCLFASKRWRITAEQRKVELPPSLASWKQRTYTEIQKMSGAGINEVVLSVG